MTRINRSGIAPLALVGTLFATLGDGLHVHTGTLAYTHPSWFGQAWWVPPNFFLTFLVMILAYAFFVGRLPRAMRAVNSMRSGEAGAFVEALMAFFLIYALTGFANAQPVLLSVILYGSFAPRWLFSYERGWLALLALAMALGGMIAEGMLGASGVVAYRHQDIYHVPWWLGGLYMHGAFTLREGLRFFVYRED